MLRVTEILKSGNQPGPVPFDLVVLPHDLRRIRRKLLTCVHGDEVLVDFAETTALAHGDCLVLEDGRRVEVIAAEEDLLEVQARNPQHLLTLAWHIGNRHLAAEIQPDRILILYDHVIGHMLEHLGARVSKVSLPFHPEGGAYGGAHQGHSHGPEDHDHGH
jgi:urease accessory protein